MENKEATTELKATAKEWKDLSCKTFHQVNKALGTKGRVMVIFGIVIVWLLGAVVAHMDDRYDRGFDRGFGMMQGRESMMGDFRRGDSQFQERGFGRNQDEQGIQGCSQRSTLEIDPENTNTQIIRSQVNCPFADQANDIQKSEGVFDGIERKIQQMFGPAQKREVQVTIPEAAIVVSTGSAK